MASDNKKCATKSLSLSSKGAIKKTVLRNIEVPLTETKNRRSVVKLPPLKPVENKSENKINKTVPTRSNVIKEDKVCHSEKKYHEPQLNTVLELEKNLEKIQISEPKKIESVSQLTPKSKNLVTQEVTKRLNFPLDQQIFKGLIPINVNDSVLMIPEKRKPIRKKYTPKSTKDPIPELSDFLKPIEPLQHILPLYDAPDTPRKPKNDNFDDYCDLDFNYHLQR